MSKKKAKAQVNEFDETLAASKSFFEKNKKAILYGGGSVLVIIILALLIHQFYITPRNLKANESIFYAEQAFMDGNYEKALNGDGANAMLQQRSTRKPSTCSTSSTLVATR